MNVNSCVNQEIKREFVYREVYACITDMAEHLFDYDGEKYAAYDEFENYGVENRCPHCREIVEEDYDDLESEEEIAEGAWVSTATFHRCPHCNEDIDWFDEEWPEIYEYWLVSPWLGEKLKAHDQIVLERHGAWVWGRQCSGQAILLDGVISRICKELGMLKEDEEASA